MDISTKEELQLMLNSGTRKANIWSINWHAISNKNIGDESLSKRDWENCNPSRKFGANLKLKNNFSLPLTIIGSHNLKPISYVENKGSAQIKSDIFAGAKTNGKTLIKASQSRDHTELLFKHLKLPIKLKRKKNFDLI